ncbi:MAG TPA: hypothetical protein PLA48_06005 [Holophaga sp.]|mgnify:CR=1 FL=1|nr:hypothetical protein [Holophaga sp.]
MSITSIGSYDIQALGLISQLGKSSSASSSSEDLFSLLGAQQDSLSISTQGQWLARTQEDNPFKTDFDELGGLISSGDLEGAQKAYAAMQEKMSGAQGGEDPLAGDFAAIGTALDSGDLTAAQAAWDTMQSSLASFSAGQPGSSSNPLKNDMDNLAALIESGDLTSAQSLYETIQEHLQAAGQTDSQGTGSSDFSDLLSTLGTALASGDASAAQTAWTELDEALQDAGASSAASGNAQGQSTDLQALLLSMYWQSSAYTNPLTNG